jgi:hypothetical protein
MVYIPELIRARNIKKKGGKNEQIINLGIA